MGMQGDFFQLLKEQGYQFGNPVAAAAGMDVPTATTILALKYRDGVLVTGLITEHGVLRAPLSTALQKMMQADSP